MAKRAKRQPRVKLEGLGVLRYVDDDMRVVPDGVGPVYAMGGVYWRIGVLAALSVTDMLAQAWWVNMSLSIGFGPWWLGVLGIDGSSFDFLGFMAGVCAVLPVVGILLVLPAFIWPRERTLFHIMMLCFWEGTSRMLGAGLGRTILYMRGVRDGVIDHFAGSGVPGPLKESDTVVGMWPAVVGGIVFAVIAFVFAVIPRRQRQGAAKPMIGIGIAASIGLFGIVLVECGWVPISFVLLLVALFMAWAVLPSEVAIARQCASKRVEPFWMWYSAELIWVETLFIFLAIMVAISGI